MYGSITLENRFGVNKMELISLKYAIFVIVLLVLYYCFPKKYRWYVLLAGSMAYYVIICKWYVLFIIFTITITISLDFFDPKVWIFSLFKPKLENLPIFSVKKFTISKNSNFIFGKNNVRRTRESFIIFAIAITFVP